MIIHLEEDFHSPPRLPELELWLDVLRLAVEDLLNLPGSHPGCPFAWFDSTDNRIGSFLWLCSLLDLNPAAARASLRGKIETRRAEHAANMKKRAIEGAWKKFHHADDLNRVHRLGWLRRVRLWEKNGWPAAGFAPRGRAEEKTGKGKPRG